jgi:hypothetical protein
VSRPSSRFSSASVLLALGILLLSVRAHAQACCAGANAVTPARLEPHENWLVGTQWHTAVLFGSFDANSHYSAASRSEGDFEQDLFGAVRVLPRAQLALLVPFVETLRTAPPIVATAPGIVDFGGGIGDVNVSGRYDFVLAGESKTIPGIAALAGLTFPTGTPSDQAKDKLASQTTGVGAYQYNFALSVEQTFGPWLAGGSFIFAARSPRTVDTVHEQLAPQLFGLVYGSYVFDTGASLALVGSYQAEGDATINGAQSLDSARRFATVSAAGLWPFNDWLRGVVTLSSTLPFAGQNDPALATLLLTLIGGFR